jgi:hypothetical protein
MKFKTLFLSMLGAAAIVSCNNDSVIGGGADGTGAAGGGESTVATFQLNFIKPGTYAGSEDLNGAGREDSISDAGLFIYKLDGTPEAMAYLVKSDFVDSQKVTVKCKSGDKLIYLAVNIGGATLIKHGENTSVSNSTGDNSYVGKDWTDPSTLGPKFFEVVGSLQALNSPIWSATSGIVLEEGVGGALISTPPATASGVADNLIKALTGNGVPANGVLTGTGGPNSFYLMSNWGDRNNQQPDNQTGTGTNYASTCKFTLEGGVSYQDSRSATPDYTNSSKKNALKINIQRAVAKIAVDTIAPAVQTGAGAGGSAAGIFVPSSKWAVGNINTSEYPFQMWDGVNVKSTRYDDTARLVNASSGWAKKMDNTRFAGTASGVSYAGQNLNPKAVRDTILSHASNVKFSHFTGASADTAYVLVTENNNSGTLDHYLTFVVLTGVYTPSSYITSVGLTGTLVTANGNASTPVPYSAGNLDTLYYVGSFDANGLFFHGMTALREYVCYKLAINNGGVINPATDTKVSAYIQDLRKVSGSKQADLQAYWQGNCFYRIWITDNNASSTPNKRLVRRNHAYLVSVSNIKGPGIGDPNDIIDPDPETIEPIDETDTYITASIEIMKWHIVKQEETLDLQ